MMLFFRLDTSGVGFTKPFWRSLGLIAIFLVALFIRIDPILTSPEMIRAGFGSFGDSFLYHRIGYNLYRGNGYSGLDNGSAFGLPQADVKIVYEPAVTRGPVYPFFLAAVYRFWGDRAAMKSVNRWHVNWDRVRIVQSVLDAMICLMLFWAARVLYPGRTLPAFLAAALYAACYYNIYYTRVLLTESVTTFLVAIAVVASVMALKTERIVYWFIAGIGFGLSSLSRPEFILFPVFLMTFVILVRRHDIRQALKSTGLLVCGLVLVVSPWTLRNYMTFKQFIPTSAGAVGLNLFNGTYETGNWRTWGKYPDELLPHPGARKEVNAWKKKLVFHLKRGTIGLREYDRRFKELALENIIKNPGKHFIVWAKRLPYLWYQNYIQAYSYPEPSGTWFIVYFLFSFLALIFMKPENRIACAPIYLLFIYMNLIYLPFHTEPRYGVAIYPGFCLLTAFGVWLPCFRLWQLFAKKRHSQNRSFRRLP